MKLWSLHKWRTTATVIALRRSFRSDAALEAITRAAEQKVSTVALYNYPSFSGSYSALFARLFHSRLQIPCLVLPFSSFEPLRVEDFLILRFEKLYLLDFLAPPGFANAISRQSLCEVIAFDHRLPKIRSQDEKVQFRVNFNKSSSVAAYEYFSAKLAEMKGSDASLLEAKDRGRVEMMLRYIEHVDLGRKRLPNVRAFSIDLQIWRSKLNSLTNPYIYEQLLDISAPDLIENGKSYIAARENAADKLLLKSKVFKVRLGRGIYGECLGIKADERPEIVDEIGRKLSIRSEADGLRPIGVIVYPFNLRLKMCLRSTDKRTNTAEVAKAYGGGGSPSRSSFVIRMDEYNLWVSESYNKFTQLPGASADRIIGRGNSYFSFQTVAAEKVMLDKVFKVRLGRGLYGECLGINGERNHHLAEEIGKQLSSKSRAVGLRPIAALVYSHGARLHINLRTCDPGTNTCEVAKAYGGDGIPSLSSFFIRREEYENHWLTPTCRKNIKVLRRLVKKT